MKKIMIGGAWPYANGSLHIGHMAALLPGDVIARYHRAKGDEVAYVSGSDCHGTPISVRANKEGVSPESIAQKYHEEFDDCFKRLKCTFTEYKNTMDPRHEEFVKGFFKDLIDNGSLYEREEMQVYCPHCEKFLPDRYVNGTCPVCGAEARGDQCDSCGSLLEPERLLNRRCAICGSEPELRPSKQLYLHILPLKEELEKFVDEHDNWRFNACNESKKYLESGLQDRAATRDLDWGIDIPLKGYEDKKIYVWFEAVLGYLSMTKIYCEETGQDFLEYWNNSYHYYVHGKDNIPFHTIILPSLLISHNHMHLPDMIVSSEYMTLEGKKISTSRNWAIWMPYLIDNYDADLIRCFFVAYGPESKDSDFSWSNFITFHNSQLVGAYGNFVNRTLAFINKYNEDIIPEGKLDPEIEKQIDETYTKVGECIEHGEFRNAMDAIFALVNFGNKYYDSEKPWTTRTEDPAKCAETLFNCAQIIANLAVLFHPFAPGSSEKVESWLGIDNLWEIKHIQGGKTIPKAELLYQRIDKKKIDEEVNKLKENTAE